MKKLLSALFALTLITAACTKKDVFNKDEIYYFYSEKCGHCIEASSYINRAHPDLKMVKIDVATTEGYNMLLKAVETFKLGNRVGTPLFIIGDNHIMGWSPRQQAKFETLVKPYLK